MVRIKFRKIKVVILAILALVVGSFLFLPASAASAGPYINCDQAVYPGNGKDQASVTCYAQSNGEVRLKAECWNGAGVPFVVETRYTNWQYIYAGQRVTYNWNRPGDFCTLAWQLARVDAEIR